MTPNHQELSRVILIDKPPGPTSFDVVRTVKRVLRDRVGHAGSLDPFASGLLLVLSGQATRVSTLLMDLPKEYVFIVQFGASSTTGDPTGEISARGGPVDGEAVLAALGRFRGRIRQRVPMTSAVKLGGEPLYRKAHRGETVETPEREVTVHDLSLLHFDDARQQARLLARTSRGTYVRTLSGDLGEALGVGAYTLELRRTHIGPFAVDDAMPVELLETSIGSDAVGSALVPLSDALAFLPEHRVTGADVARARNGNELKGTPAGRFRVRGPEGLLGVYEGPPGLSRPVVVFSSPQD